VTFYVFLIGLRHFTNVKVMFLKSEKNIKYVFSNTVPKRAVDRTSSFSFNETLQF